MVFQRPVLLRRTVAQNIDYALKQRDIPRTRRGAIIDDVLSRTGLARFAKSPARHLSGGEQQKLALARAWATKPQVLFLDEPTASLDPAATHAVENIIGTMHAEGTRIIMTTHDLAQAKRHADDVLFIYQGRLLEKTPADVFFTAPKSGEAAAFLKGELRW
jgi:tungstate transport system ATP-binding protein